MSDAPVVVVDTSIHLSSELFSQPGSPAREVIARGFDGHFTFALSPLLLREIARKLAENGINPNVTAEYLANVRSAGREFDDRTPQDVFCSDPEDVFVMILARTAAAWCIVAYDNALLDDNATPPGWDAARFLGRLRVRRGEPVGNRFVS